MANLPYIIDSQNKQRYLGNLLGKPRFAWRPFGAAETERVIPRAEWPALIERYEGEWHSSPFLTPIHDQDGIGMCNCSATAAAIEMARSTAGLPYVALSGGDLYRRISGGSDRGSLLEDGIREAMANGVAAVDVVPYLEWRRAPSGWQQSAANYKVLEACICPTFDHMMSAVLHGFTLISGIMWYSIYEPASDGWMPESRRGGGGGHAICGYRPARKGDKYGIVHRNSWTPGWGVNGCMILSEAMYGREITGCWAVRAAVNESGDLPSPA